MMGMHKEHKLNLGMCTSDATYNASLELRYVYEWCNKQIVVASPKHVRMRMRT